MGKKKYYVVWHGVNPGIYDSWVDCKLQINGFDKAIYKSFDNKEDAEQAYASSPHLYIQPKKNPPKTESTSFERKDTILPLPTEVLAEALAVDAACSGNPGPMEYRGVYLRTGETIFHYGPVYGTNNIGEFLAIVHALALMQQKGINLPVYSDSHNAITWVKQKCCKTKLERNARTEKLFQMIERAESWLKKNPSAAHILKWETKKWGEVPADFGRK